MASFFRVGYFLPFLALEYLELRLVCSGLGVFVVVVGVLMISGVGVVLFVLLRLIFSAMASSGNDHPVRVMSASSSMAMRSAMVSGMRRSAD